MNPTPSARALAKQIVKEANVLIKFGRTNGQEVLHVSAIGGCAGHPDQGSFTIKTEAEWETCPLNHTTTRRKSQTDERLADELSELIANKDAI